MSQSNGTAKTYVELKVCIYGEWFTVAPDTKHIYIALASPTGKTPLWGKTFDEERGWDFLHSQIKDHGGMGTLELWNVSNKQRPKLERLLGCIMVNSETKQTQHWNGLP